VTPAITQVLKGRDEGVVGGDNTQQQQKKEGMNNQKVVLSLMHSLTA